MATTTKVIVYTKDGVVNVASPSPKFMAPYGTEQEGLDAIQALVVPQGATNVAQVESNTLPSRGQRGYWTQAGAVAPTISGTAAAPPPPSGRDFLKNGVVPNITGANTGAKLDRLATVCVADPAISLLVDVCNTHETLSSGDHTFLRKTWAKKKTEAQGGLSATEVGAIEAVAAAYEITLP